MPGFPATALSIQWIAGPPFELIDSVKMYNRIDANFNALIPYLTGGITGAEGSGTLATADVAASAIILPVGVWSVTMSGYFQWSTATARSYAATIFNLTATAAISSVSCNAGLSGSMPFSITRLVTLVTPSTLQARVHCSALDGTQLYTTVAISAVAATTPT